MDRDELTLLIFKSTPTCGSMVQYSWSISIACFFSVKILHWCVNIGYTQNSSHICPFEQRVFSNINCFFDYSCSSFAKQGKAYLLFVVLFGQSFLHLDNRYKKAHNGPFTVAQHAADMMIWMKPIYHSKACGVNLSYTFTRILLMTSVGLSYPWFQCIPATKYLIWFLFIPPLPFYDVLRSVAASKM